MSIRALSRRVLARLEPVRPWLAVGWTLAILVACLLPGSSVPTIAWQISPDKLVHLAMFAGFGVLWMWAASRPGRDVPTRRTRALWVLAVGAFYGALTEFLQYVTPVERAADPLDFAADLVGLVLAVAVYRLWPRRPASTPSPREGNGTETSRAAHR
jgi:VanZ family protein